jgi:hypothetical protein
MQTLDLSSLSANVVEAAALPSQKQEPIAPVSTSGQVASQTPAAQGHVSVEEEPLMLGDTISPITNTPEKVSDALDKLEDIIELGDPDDEDEDDQGENGITKSKDTNSVYPALASFLKEKGIIDTVDEINDEESFVSAITKTIEAGKYSTLNQNQLLYLKSLEAGIPEEESKVLVSSMDSVSRIDAKMLTDTPDLAERIIAEDLKSQGWDEARINKQIERLRKTDELVSEGLTAKDNIIERSKQDIEDAKAQKIALKAEREKKETQQLLKLKDSVFSYDKALSAVKVDDRLKNQVYEAMTKPVGVTDSGAPLNTLLKDRQDDPVDFEKRMYYAYVLTNGFRDISRLQRRAESSAARKLKDVVSGLSLDMSGSSYSPADHDENIKIPDIVNV